jgi:hypothetical protein
MLKTAIFSRPACLLVWLALSGTAWSAQLKSLTVCADPGNMPLSNQKGEGFENKIAQLIGASLGTGVQYYWRPSIDCPRCTVRLLSWHIAATRASI